MRDREAAHWIDRYHRDGYYAPIRVLSTGEARACRGRLEAFEAARGPLQGDLRHRAHLFLVWLDELVRDTRILDTVEAVLGENLLVWSSSFFIKEGRADAHVPWHQDARAFGAQAPDVVTAWVALTDSTPENGALQVIRGSHHRGAMVHTMQHAPGSLLARRPETALGVDRAAATIVPLRAGEMSLHHPSLVHGSPPNRTDGRRIGIAIRYARPGVGRGIGRREPALLVRGIDAWGSFDPLPRPGQDADPVALARHAELLSSPESAPAVRVDAETWPRAITLRGMLLARDGRGLLVCGPPGSGKSTLAGALTRRGWISMETGSGETDEAPGRTHLSAILLLGRGPTVAGGALPAAMPAAHALLALLPYRSGADPADLVRGLHELEPLANAVPVYESAAGSDWMVDAVVRLGDAAAARSAPPRAWADVHESAASRPAVEAGQDMEAIHG